MDIRVNRDVYKKPENWFPDGYCSKIFVDQLFVVESLWWIDVHLWMYFFFYRNRPRLLRLQMG